MPCTLRCLCSRQGVERAYSLSNPWLVNFSVRLFSVTVRTTWSGAPAGISASISSVTVTFAPTRPARCAMTSSAMRLASRPTRVGVERDRAVEALRAAVCGAGAAVGSRLRPGPGGGRPFAADGRVRRASHPRAAATRLGLQLLARDLRLHQQPRRSRVGQRHAAARRAGRGSGRRSRRSCRRRQSCPAPRSAARRPSRIAPSSTDGSLSRGR